MRKEDAALMTAEEIARYNESLLCVPGEAARLRDLTRLRGRDVRWGVSVRRTSLRAKPTDALCPTRAGDRYDDPLQLTAVLPNEPMALLGESADGRFCRAETSYYAGWVPAEDIGLCRDLEAWRTAQEGGFLRVTGSRVTLCCDPYEPRVSGAALPMGTSLPLAALPGTVRALRGRMSYDNYLVRLPVQGDRRKTELACTEKAQAVIARGRQRQADFQAALFGGIDAQSREAFSETLRSIERNLDEIMKENG